MIVITGANGKLGQHVVKNLVKVYDPRKIVAAVRNPAKAQELRQWGLQVVQADYEEPATLASAFKGAEKVLLISSSEIGKRFAQHKAVIEAAQAAKVQHLVYTSLLRADVSKLGLAAEHLETESLIKKAGLAFSILRNGWYLENHTEHLAPALEYGVIMGAAAKGRFSSAAREDYAAAAVKVLTTSGHEGKIYELAGGTSFSLYELAEAIAQKSKRPVVYKDMPMADFEKALLGVGVPAGFAHLLADSDLGASQGELQSDRHDLTQLIGRPTITLAEQLNNLLG